MVRASARQKLELCIAWFVPVLGKISTAVASSRNFNDATVRNRWFTNLISGRMEY